MAVNGGNKKSIISRILEHLAEEVIDRVSLGRKLLSGQTLTVKLGADPSAPDLHLGHALVLRKLKDFQDLGHRVVFVVGDFTAAIGDPSGRNESRPSLGQAEVRKNAETYLAQAGKALDLRKTEVRYNSEWFSKMRLADFVSISANFSMSRIMDREDFKKRIAGGREVSLHEALYQTLQAYDSVAIKADVEIGGRDQKLNLLAGRELQKKMGLPAQDVVITPLLIGLDGSHKMSKSLKNHIALFDSPAEMFGKTMSIPDSLIKHYAELAAFLDPQALKKVESLLRRAPFKAKQLVAESIVRLYWSPESAEAARRAFTFRHTRRGHGDGAYEKQSVPASARTTLVEAVIMLGGAASRSSARRLILGKAVEVDGKVAEHPAELIDFSKEHYFRIGKKIFKKTAPA